MKFTRRFENHTLVQDRTAGLQSLGGLIQPPPALFRGKKGQKSVDVVCERPPTLHGRKMSLPLGSYKFCL